jgi:hypothetical protein
MSIELNTLKEKRAELERQIAALEDHPKRPSHAGKL